MQITAWIQFKVEVEDGNVVTVDTVDKAFNSRMMKVFKLREAT